MYQVRNMSGPRPGTTDMHGREHARWLACIAVDALLPRSWTAQDRNWPQGPIRHARQHGHAGRRGYRPDCRNHPKPSLRHPRCSGSTPSEPTLGRSVRSLVAQRASLGGLHMAGSFLLIFSIALTAALTSPLEGLLAIWLRPTSLLLFLWSGPGRGRAPGHLRLRDAALGFGDGRTLLGRDRLRLGLRPFLPAQPRTRRACKGSRAGSLGPYDGT